MFNNYKLWDMACAYNEWCFHYYWKPFLIQVVGLPIQMANLSFVKLRTYKNPHHMQSIEKSIYFHFFLKMIFVKADHNVDKIFLFSLFPCKTNTLHEPLRKDGDRTKRDWRESVPNCWICYPINPNHGCGAMRQSLALHHGSCGTSSCRRRYRRE